ncbi:MAG: dolichol kinase [Spirochaetia bacterium]|nr:dolichol kinase [Spirochaetia bacterium]
MSGQFNVLRKIFHFSGIIFIIIYYKDLLYNFPGNFFLENTRSVLFYFFLVSLILLGFLEFLRFRFAFFQKLFVMFAGKMLKPDEVNKVHGSVPFFLGLLVCTGFFLKEVAILSSLYLMIGDPCAAWFGEKFGKHKLYNGKSFEGLIAGTLSAFFSGVLFLGIILASEPESFIVKLIQSNPFLFLITLFISAVCAFCIELFSTKGFLDDNLLIPAASGFVMSLCLIIFFQINSSQVFFSIQNLLIPR